VNDKVCAAAWIEGPAWIGIGERQKQLLHIGFGNVEPLPPISRASDDLGPTQESLTNSRRIFPDSGHYGRDQFLHLDVLHHNRGERDRFDSLGTDSDANDGRNVHRSAHHHTIRPVKSLTPAGEVLAAEIARSGPIPFSHFMDVALYHPDFGYYRVPRDPFGVAGDFYTAEQLQPVFGRLVRAYLRILTAGQEPGDPLTVVELGAGRTEMASALTDCRYIPLGVVFSNEFFDAVPVDVIAGRGGSAVERRVDFDGNDFHWTDGPEIRADLEEGLVRETQTQRLLWLDRIDERLERGYIVTIDYGFTRRELIRFPQGTLMSYRRHQALEDVLAEPGTRDITAHVAFTDLQERGEALGWTTIAFETLAQMIIRAAAPDQFERALAADTQAERARYRVQLKSLLFGMGETFRVLVQRKG
jgi:SAM-dependent MidA family methyltransferase